VSFLLSVTSTLARSNLLALTSPVAYYGISKLRVRSVFILQAPGLLLSSDPNLRLNRHHFVLFGPQQDPKCKILTNICCHECEKNLNIASKLCTQIPILLKITQYLLLHWGLYYKTLQIHYVKKVDRLISKPAFLCVTVYHFHW
jgi:hypothetical protein